MKTPITGDKFNRAVCEALGLEEPKVRRIIIDSPFGSAVRVLVEYIGDERLVDLDLITLLDGARVDERRRDQG